MCILLLTVALWSVFTVASSAKCVQGATISGNRGNIVLTLEYGDKEYVYAENVDNIGDFTVREELQKRGMDKAAKERMQLVDGLLQRGMELREAMNYCFPRLEDVIDTAIGDINLKPVSAEIRFNPDSTPMFEISRSTPGLNVDKDQAYEDIYFSLRRGIGHVALTVDVLSPEHTARELAAYTFLRASYETSYTSSKAARKHNIRTALNRVNGTVLEVGEEFSFNNIVGARTIKNGFQAAGIIVGGEYTEGVGGGVCQASTAIYNCALRAGMKITAVSQHSLVPSYVEPSFDAMVNGSGSDLKFKNTTEAPIFIRTVVEDGKARVEMYSEKADFEVECKSVTLEMGARPEDEEFIDEDRKYTEGLASGEKVRISGAAPAVKSEGYLIYHYSDGTTEKIKIRQDNYKETRGKVAIAP